MTAGTTAVHRQRLTPLFSEALKPKRGLASRHMVYDSTVPALAVRITESGHKVSYWPLVSPVAGTKPAAISEMLVGRRLSRSLRRVKRRGLGFPRGVDPKEEQRRQRAAKEAEKLAELRAKSTSFSALTKRTLNSGC